MSERPTPRTDAFFATFADGEAAPSHAEYYDRLCQLERELDEAREENLEQARLLGMSGEREADLRGELEREKRRAEENGVLAHDLGIQIAEAREEIATLRSEEQRLIAFSKRDRKRADDLSDKLAQVVCERDRLAQVIETANVMISANALRNVLIAYDGLRGALAAVKDSGKVDGDALTGDLVGFDSEAKTLTLKMQQMPAAATLGERVALHLPNIPDQPR